MVELISKQNHIYASRMRRVGTKYSASEAHATFLVSRGLASPAKAEAKPAPVQKAEVKASAPKPTYQSASLSAESKDDAPEKKHYKRRDLTSDEK